MPLEIIQGVLLPFVGTTLGASGVFFLRRELNEHVQRALTGFAAGVMTAASVWSLLLPALEQAAEMGRWAFVPAVAGVWLGVLFLLGLDRLIPHLHRGSDEPEGLPSKFSRATKLTLAVVLHNIPEGMAVGAVIAGGVYGNEGVALTGALVLSLGIAIQNFPEGAIIAIPLRGEGVSKARAFLYGMLSGAVEPVAAVLTAGRAAGYLCWAASALLGLFLLPDKGVALLYLIFLGLYPVVKNNIEGLRRLPLEWLCKLACFNAALSLFWFALRALFLPDPPVWLGERTWLLYLAGNLIFVLYDVGLSRLIALVMARMPGRRR